MATADLAASFHIRDSAYTFEPAPSAHTVDRSSEFIRRMLSDFRPGILALPIPIAPKWLNETQKRIRASVIPQGAVAMDDGRWLSRDVADAAILFFRRTADLLPGDPFIYSSRQGDLIAEFTAPHGTMTSVISPSFVILFAMIDGTPIERKLAGIREVREEVRLLTSLLHTGQHGPVDSGK